MTAPVETWCPYDNHAASCRCHYGHAIMVDITPAVGESIRQRYVRERNEVARLYGVPERVVFRTPPPEHPLEEVLRSVEQDQATEERIETERDRILDAARHAITGARQRDYGSPEPGFTRTGKMWAAILGLEEVTAEQVALCMAALKISRLATNPSHRDSWVDGPGYFALGGEVAYERGVAELNAAMRGEQL